MSSYYNLEGIKTELNKRLSYIMIMAQIRSFMIYQDWKKHGLHRKLWKRSSHKS